jgi:hypothetical protein
MTISKYGKIILLLSVGCVTTFAGILASQSPQNKDDQSDVLEHIKTLQKILTEQEHILEKRRRTPQESLQLSNEATEVIKDAIPYEQPLVTHTNSPIKIRGGAMTFRLGAHYDWKSNHSQPCVNLSAFPTTIDLDGVVPVGGAPANPSPLPSQDWQIDFFGHLRDKSAMSPNGIRVAITHKQCDGSAGMSATFTPENQNSTFYEFDQDNLYDEDGQTRIKRFKDKSCTSKPDPAGDEDNCEHIHSIYINKSITSDPTAKPDYIYRCTNGECKVEIG